MLLSALIGDAAGDSGSARVAGFAIDHRKVAQGTVFGAFPGAVDTDMIRQVDIPKTPAATVAQAVLEGIIAETEDIFPDPMSKQLYSAWRVDHKAVEHQFASM